jgi:hypothetical protein
VRREGVALLGALALACGGPASEEPVGTKTPAPGSESITARVTTPGVEARRRADGDLDLVALEVERLEVLAALAEAAGLHVRKGLGRPGPRVLDLTLRGATAEEALAAVLSGVPHHLHYERDAGGTVALSAVTVGLLPEPTAAAAERTRFLERMDLRHRVRRGRTTEELEAIWADRMQRVAKRREEIETKRRAPNSVDRARAASLMLADEHLGALIELLGSDPSPEVRASAAASLADAEAGADAFEAAAALLAALEDPAPEVVTAAVEALEDIHDVMPDPRIRHAVADQAEHPDPEVRAAVASFEDWVGSE